MCDTIVEEVRKTRDEYARRFNYDLHAMCVDLRREQELSGAQVVSFAKKPVDLPVREHAQADTTAELNQ
ncbi:MAG: hypothetical protein WCJ35_29025 [Planctomycetota bacterium]